MLGVSPAYVRAVDEDELPSALMGEAQSRLVRHELASRERILRMSSASRQLPPALTRLYVSLLRATCPAQESAKSLPKVTKYSSEHDLVASQYSLYI